MIRLEKKYILYSQRDKLRLIKFLYKKGFNNIYKDRINFSIYFDYKNLKFFHDSEEGLSYRTKLRLRNDKKYFKNDYSSFDFEIKKSNPNFKKKFSLKKDIIYKDSNLLSEKKNFEKEIMSKKLIPILSTQYVRSYYHSKKYGRITIDQDLEYQSVYWKNFVKVFHFLDLKRITELLLSIKLKINFW